MRAKKKKECSAKLKKCNKARFKADKGMLSMWYI